MLDQSDIRIKKDLHNKIEQCLSSVGLLYRVFARVKSEESLQQKILRGEGKYGEDKKIQDLFGIRVVLYFRDDIEIAQNILKHNYVYDELSSTIDVPTTASFRATRFNLIFKLPDEYLEQSVTVNDNDMVDGTFEVQIRTVLSEGWHEVEHDLRYKCKEDWENYDDLNRSLNGVFASLETSEWTMSKLFDELSYRHYKSCEWAQMLRTKFRLRAGNQLSGELNDIFNDDNGIGKKLFRVDRNKFIKKIFESRLELPLNLDNLVYMCNFWYVSSQSITDATPEPILDMLSSS